MIRLIIWGVSLGVLVAAGFLSAASQPAWRSAIASWLGAPDLPAEAILALENPPICTSMGEFGSEADWAELDPDFAAGKKALATEDWNGAIGALRFASLRDPRNADIWNYIGYAHRRLRQSGPAMQHYQQALVLNPRHRGAHGHLGELYLVLDDLAKAEEHLAALERICLIGCAELGDLERATAMYKDSGKR
jgi:tetratricopeptide (TPR) repeat protein